MFYSLLKILRKIYLLLHDADHSQKLISLPSQKDYANQLIYKLLISDKPIMITRFGATEASCISNFIGVKKSKKNILDYIKGRELEWWWDKKAWNQLQVWSGFFPINEESIRRFSELYLNEMHKIDLLGSWLKSEKLLLGSHLPNQVLLEDLEPFFTNTPWTKALAGKNVLVVHPFDSTIQSQYKFREKLFDNDLLPEFNLITYKSVQTLADSNTQFETWFDALDFMKSDIRQIDFDICIIGCGAYGLPLAAFVKDLGKKAIHLGGVTQLLFGIIGKRWESYVRFPYFNLFNEFWTRPIPGEVPAGHNKIEDGCYW